MGIKKSLGAKIKNLRKELGITQEYFAELLDMNVRQIVRIENGESFPTADNIEKIAEKLNVDAHELFLLDTFLPEDEMRERIKQKALSLNGEKLKSLYIMAKSI